MAKPLAHQTENMYIILYFNMLRIIFESNKPGIEMLANLDQQALPAADESDRKNRIIISNNYLTCFLVSGTFAPHTE
jgi:hypothetical protein